MTMWRPPTCAARGEPRPSGPKIAAGQRPPGETGRQSPHLLVVGAGNSFGRLSGGQGGGCTKSRGGVTFAAAATALGAGGLNSRTTSRPKRFYIWGRSGDCVQVWSDAGAATQQGLQPSGAGASTRPGFLRRLGTGAAPTEATGAAGDRPRPPMQYLSLTLGGEVLVGGSSVAKEH